LKELLKRYFDTPDKKAKLYLIITLAQIWAIIAMVIGFIVFLYYLLKGLNVLVI